jgi:hypothetical protein
MSAREELDQIKRKGRENWLSLRRQQGPPPPLGELQAKGREDWLKLRQQRTRESSREAQDRSAERTQDTEPTDPARNSGSEIDDDLK